MADDNLRRRLEKLVALRDHPSTLPAIRDQAARAYERLSAKTTFTTHFTRRGRRIEHDTLWDDICEVCNRETRRIWPSIKPKYPNAR